MPCMGGERSEWYHRKVGLTLSEPDSDDTDEAEECCLGLEMDMGESAL